MAKLNLKIERIKSDLTIFPDMARIGNKNIYLSRKISGEKNAFSNILKESDKIDIIKMALELDRNLRAAKHQLKEENKLSTVAGEDDLIKILEQKKQLELGYEPQLRL